MAKTLTILSRRVVWVRKDADADIETFWSRYTKIHEFVTEPFCSLVNIVGGDEKVHAEIKQLIQNGLETHIVKL